MTCIKIKNKQALQDRLFRDGKTELVAMFGKVGVMDSITSKPKIKLDIIENHNLSGIILADSYSDLGLTIKNGVEYGAKLQRMFNLNSNPVNLVDGKLLFANNFNLVQRLVNDRITKEYSKTQSVVDNTLHHMILDPVQNREHERLREARASKKLQYKNREEELAKPNPDKRVIEAIDKRIGYLNRETQETSDFMKVLDRFPTLNNVFKRMDADRKQLNLLIRTPDKLTDADITYMRKTVMLWRAITDDTSDKLGLKDDGVFQDEILSKRLNDMLIFVNRVGEDIHKLYEKKGAQKAEKDFKDPISSDDLFKWAKDDNIFTTYVRGLKQSINPLVQLIADLLNKTTTLAKTAFKTVEVEIDRAYKNVKSEIGENFDDFIAEDENGNPQGALADRLSVKYWRLKHRADRASFAQKKKWFKDNTTVVDFNILFDDYTLSGITPSKFLNEHATQEAKDAFKEGMINALGQEGYNEYMDVATSMFANYVHMRDNEYDLLTAETGALDAAGLNKFRLWNEHHSPFVQSKLAISWKVKGVTGKMLSMNNDIIMRIPKRKIAGEDTGFYDKKFESIMNNPKKAEFYAVAKKIFDDARINYGYYNGIHPNALPYLERTARENLINGDRGVGKAWDTFKQSFWDKLDTKGKKDHKPELDIEGNEIKRVGKGIITIDAKMQNLFEYKVLEFKTKEGRDPTAREQAEMSNEASTEAGANQELDLPKLLKLLAVNSIAYKYKFAAQDELDGLIYLFEKGHKDDTGKVLKHTAEFLENTVNSDFYAIATKSVRGDVFKLWGKTGRLSNENKAKAGLIDDEIDRINSSNLNPEDKEIKKKELREKQLGLYDKVYISELIRAFIGYTRILGIGYNPISAATNMAFGQIGNFQRAIQGDYFNIRDMHNATMIVATQQGKVAAIADKVGLVGDVTYSLMSKPTTDVAGSSRLASISGKLDPYNFQTVSESYNQEPIMVAMMKNTIVTMDGKESNLFDIMDENGEVEMGWKDAGDLEGNDILTQAMGTIRDVVQETHGDYNSTFAANNEEWLQALLMFRRWLPEMAARRLSTGGTDFITGKDRTGLYVNPIKVLAKKLQAKKDGKDYNMTDDEKKKLKALAFGEISVGILLALAGMLTKAMICDDPKCKDAGWAMQTAMNLLKRVNEEVTFFANPGEWLDLFADPISGLRTLKDFQKFMAQLPSLWNWDSSSSFYSSGRNKGSNKGITLGAKFIPGLNQAMRLWRYGNEPSYEMSLGSLWDEND
jgi:hypothetical protein